MRLPATCHPARVIVGFGLCSACYQKAYINKKSATCHPEKPHVSKGLCGACYKKTFSREHQTKIARKYNLKKFYGLTVEQYDQMRAEQANVCAICQTHPTAKKGSFHVDHNHNTGKIRGLLCHNCNVGLGVFKDDTALLTKAIEYLDINL